MSENHTASHSTSTQGLASIGKRVGATLLDLLIVGIPTVIVVGILIGFSVSPASPAYWLISLVTYAYFFLMENRDGQTIGKKVLNVRVVADDGGPAETGAIALRTLLRVVDGLFFYLVGFVVAMVNDENKRVGDMVGNTRVVDA